MPRKTPLIIKRKGYDHFVALTMAVATMSDSRDEASDSSGKALMERLIEAGHQLKTKQIVHDDIYAIRALLSQWIADPQIQVILTNGGTGFTARDTTPEAVIPLLDKQIDGFGELFRWNSIEEIGTSTVQSRALGGIANGTFIFCLPGSTSACISAWEKILKAQLDSRTKPCNFVELLALE